MIEFSPDDEQAFINFEAACRIALDEKMSRLGRDDDWSEPRMEYMSLVQAAAEGYAVDPELTLQRDDNRHIEPEDFQWFKHAALKLVTHLKIRTTRSVRSDTTQLEPADRTTIQAEIERLKMRVSKSSLPPDQSAALVQRLDELLDELNRPRLAFAGLFRKVLALAPFMGQSGVEALKLSETLSQVLSLVGSAVAKDEAHLTAIAHFRQKAIKHLPEKPTPKPEPAPDWTANLDDEIPF